MNDFLFYTNQGISHILDINGLDHLCFIISFSLFYTFKDWRKLLGVVTVFTVGHCITLVLSGFNIVRINSGLVETLIPITIMISCLYNFKCLFLKTKQQQSSLFTYGVLLVFGLIHGLGFSNYLRMMLFEEDSILVPLFGFNVGIEIAQLLIVLLFLSFIFISNKISINRTFVLWCVNGIVTLFVIKLLFF
ncbi:HupE/UreJ family protein [Wenyingzhuangia sp. 2_MG-2023]|uniref:HupE/UreJ family protein n=1 Tax=Wenyingzhuangia sp. 2_MG-2023 TaxID=3062639 RepID=UPI0026E31108|nr:HupE/UreJ family protein [Wenyingzhuangia sp. 2_MG-2023]MDO6739240.1 HupE/UreJ family protein [Wenyingzhuangia sp. 2_MG-2023]MDO6803862.1 HupE/UreJ family protein [Wenyingzhuangia sp. 1_MG-2023]